MKSIWVFYPDSRGDDRLEMVIDDSEINRLVETYPEGIYFEATLVTEFLEVTIEEKIAQPTHCEVRIDDILRFRGRSYNFVELQHYD